MKKLVCIVLVLIFCLLTSISAFAEYGGNNKEEFVSALTKLDPGINLQYGGVYLCEASTGKVLFADSEYKEASPASVTKVMTLLLVCEALEEGRINLNDVCTISANAASMGGSQVFLEEGERITVEDLIKSCVIASGNDASVALAELCAGSEAAFVKQMNQKAVELGLRNTHFENCTGLDDTTKEHYSCAADIGKMSRALIEHEIILKYSSIWQDSIRNGEFVLTNTNRLVRYYDGCNGLKTGSTDKAGFCVTTTAKRENIQLIAVVMGAETRDNRNAIARQLLDFGFANYALYERAECFVEMCEVIGGNIDSVELYSTPFSCVIDKAKIKSVELLYEIPETINAPLKSGDNVGCITYMVGEEQIGVSNIYVKADVTRISLVEIWGRILKRIICGKI